MNTQKRHISERFEGFEPDLDNSEIEAGWDKVKPFLPQNKRRRVFFFLRMAVSTPVLIFSLVILSSAGLVAYFYEPENNRQLVAEKKAKVAMKEHEVAARHDNARVIPEKEANQKFNHLSKKTKKRLDLQTNVFSKVTFTKKSFKLGLFTPSTKKESVTAIITRIPNHNTSESVPSATSENHAILESYNLDDNAVRYQKLNLIYFSGVPLLLSEDSTDFVNLIFDDFNKQNPICRNGIMLEVFGGLNRSATDINKDRKDVSEHHRNNFAGGFSLVLPFRQKWALSGSVILSRDNYSEVFHTSGNRIISTSTTGISPTSIDKDTLVNYFEVHSSNKITSRMAYYFGFGLGYELYKKRRIKLEAFADMSLRSVQYKSTVIHAEVKDTLFYFKNTASPPLENVLSISETERTHKKRVTSFGIIPGLTLSYSISPKMEFFFSPSYFYQLSKDKLKLGQSIYALQKNNLFVNFGVRFKLFN